MSTTSTYMGFPVSTISVDSGLDWETNLNAALSIIDSHNHSAGQGQQIQPNGLNINSDLSFQSNNAIALRAARFTAQLSPISNTGSDIGEIYVSGNELYYNDVTGGNQVQLTLNGSVNATSSGISSGNSTAAFAAGVLLVKSSSTSFGNVAMQSALLANAGNLVNQLTLQAPALSSSFAITLPAVPGSQSFMALDASGNMSGYAAVSGGLTTSNLSASAGIVGTQLSATAGITGAQIASATVAKSNQVAVGQQKSSSSGSASSNSGSFTDVTNLSVSITTSGRPVIVFLQPDGTNPSWLANTGGSSTNFQILRGVTSVANFNFVSNAFTAPSAVFALDAPTAGTYTYKVQYKIVTGGAGVVQCNNAVLVAYEL